MFCVVCVVGVFDLRRLLCVACWLWLWLLFIYVVSVCCLLCLGVVVGSWRLASVVVVARCF